MSRAMLGLFSSTGRIHNKYLKNWEVTILCNFLLFFKVKIALNEIFICTFLWRCSKNYYWSEGKSLESLCIFSLVLNIATEHLESHYLVHVHANILLISRRRYLYLIQRNFFTRSNKYTYKSRFKTFYHLVVRFDLAIINYIICILYIKNFSPFVWSISF